MAQTRTYDPSEGDDLAKLVRDALGENIRPTEPGSYGEPRSGNGFDVDPDDEDDDDSGTASLLDLPELDL